MTTNLSKLKHKEKKTKNNEQNLSSLWGSTKQSTLKVTTVSGEQRREGSVLFEEIMTINVSHLF